MHIWLTCVPKEFGKKPQVVGVRWSTRSAPYRFMIINRSMITTGVLVGPAPKHIVQLLDQDRHRRDDMSSSIAGVKWLVEFSPGKPPREEEDQGFFCDPADRWTRAAKRRFVQSIRWYR
jgi:hypothetical protein